MISEWRLICLSKPDSRDWRRTQGG